MDSGNGPTVDRRKMLALLGSSSTLALAGCSGDSGNGNGDGNGNGEETPTPEDTVPDEYATATSLGGTERNPDSLSSKSGVEYQEQPNDGQQCSGCSYYIEDKNGDGTGACAIVEGNIEPDAWCVSYVPYEEDGAAEAVEVPDDASCAVCGMNAADFPDWNAQTVHEDDTREYFCSTGCAVTYHTVPEEFAETDADIAGFWVTGFESRELIDGTEAVYALETDSDRLEDPMGTNPVPFANRADAVAFVDEVDYLSEEDIVELSDFDRELAEQYRGRHLE
jgi:nitrous oxide reductase accessory protein NosL